MPDGPMTIDDALGALVRLTEGKPRGEQALATLRWHLHRRAEIREQAREQCDRALGRVAQLERQLEVLTG